MGPTSVSSFSIFFLSLYLEWNILFYVMLCCAVLRYLSYVMLFDDMLCYVMLCS